DRPCPPARGEAIEEDHRSEQGNEAVVAFALLAGIAMRPIDVPNHHYMLFYTSLAFAITLSASRENRFELVQVNFRWIIIALMGIATIQRLVQPNFMNGDYLGFATALGGFANPILKLFPENLAIAEANHTLVESFRNIAPEQSTSIVLDSPIPALPWVAKTFMITILFIEAWICFLMWRIPKHWLTHLSIMVFGVALAVLRQELVFISVICLLGLLTCDADRKRTRIAYAILAILVTASVVKTVVMPGPLQ
ncbi:MAG: hypothetical protein AAGC68_04010, partial [Verrucomicrobiota bacterium]